MLVSLSFFAALGMGTAMGGVDPTAVQPSEMNAMHRWAAAHLNLPAATQPSQPAPPGIAGVPEWPFSFVYGDRPFIELARSWRLDRTSR